MLNANILLTDISSMDITMAKFWGAIIKSCVLNKEFPFWKIINKVPGT